MTAEGKDLTPRDPFVWHVVGMCVLFLGFAALVGWWVILSG